MLESFKIREKHLEQKNKLWKRLVMSNRYVNMMTLTVLPATRLDNVLEHTPQLLVKLVFILISWSSAVVPAVRSLGSF